MNTFDSLSRAGLLEIGDGYRAKNSELGGAGPIFLRSAYLQDSGFILTDPERFVTQQIERFGAKLSRIGDVVITTKGNSTGRIGRIRTAEAEAVYSPHLSYWRSRSDRHLDQSFLYYWAASEELRRQLAGMAHSTDMAPYLSLRDQLRLRISLPHISRQIEIGRILSALDDKVELNRRMNETLEASARALFRDWFVDFGPTRAKAEGRPAYLASDLWSLFPDRLDDDGLPAGWGNRSIYDFANVIYGAPFASDRFNQDGIGRPLARIRDLSDHKAGQFTDEVHRKEYIIRPGSIVVGMDGEFRARIWHGVPTLMNQRICAFEPKSEHLRCFVWQSIEPLLAVQEGSAIGTTVIHLGKKDIDRFVVRAPDARLLDAFGALIEPLIDIKVKNGEESRTLAATRDALLPKLMSGELRVRDAEALAA